MAGAERVGDVVRVALEDGRTVEGSHCLLALGSIPTPAHLGLDAVGDNLGGVFADEAHVGGLMHAGTVGEQAGNPLRR